MSKSERYMNIFNDQGNKLFDYFPLASFAWKLIENDLLLIKYNDAASKFYNGNLKIYIGMKASEFYKDQFEILKDLKTCAKDKSSFSKKRKYKFEIEVLDRIILINYNFIPPDIIITHFNDITQEISTERELLQTQYNLKERIKELSFMYSLSNLIERIDISNDDVLSNSVILLPTAFQIPKMISARIIYDNKEYKTINFKESKWNLSYNEIVNEKFLKIELFYSENHTFLEEENHLLIESARRLKNFLEAKQSEDKLKQSEQKYRLITENVNDLIIILNKNYKFEYINESVHQKQRGTTNKDLIGTSPLELIHPDDVDKNIKAFKDIFKCGEGQLETRVRNLWGGYNWFEMRGKLFEDVDGEKKILIVSRDITERKVAQEIILKEKKFTETALNAQRDTFFVFNPFTNESIRWNKAFKDISGYTDEEIRNLKAPENYYSEEDLKRAAEATHQLNTESEVTIQMNLITKDGKSIPFEYVGSRINDEKGNLKYIVSVGRDITERLKTEQKLKESKENFRTIIEDSHLAITILQDDIVVYTNQRMADMFGYEREEMLKWTPKEYVKTVAEDSLEFFMEQAKKKKFGDPSVILHYPIHCVKSSGKKFWVDNISKTIMYNQRPADLITIIDITDKQKAEEKLRLSEKKFRSLFKGVPHFTIAWQKKGDNFILIDFNYNMEKIANGKISERIGVSASQLYLKEQYRPDLVENLKKCFEEKKNFSIETRIYIDYINRERDFLITYCYISTNFVVTHIEDITRRKREEQKLKDSEEKYRLITENANDLIYILTQDFRLEYKNDNVFEKHLGFTIEDLKGKTPLEFVHPEDVDKVRKGLKERFQYGEGCLDIRIRDKKNNYHWVEIRGKIFTDVDGKSKSLSIARDITERKLADQKLQESEEKFRTLAEQSFLGIVILQDNIIKYGNKKIADIFGYNIEDFLTWKVSEFLKVIHPEDRKFVANQAIKKQTGRTDAIDQYQFRGIKKNGDKIWLEVFSKTINYEGKLADFVTLIDITERKTAEKILLESNEKFKSLFKGGPNFTIAWQNINEDFTVINYNIGAEKISKGNIKGWLGKKATEMFLKEQNRPDLLENLRDCFKNQKNYSIETRMYIDYLDKDRDLIIRYNYVPPNLVLTHSEDITEKKKAEEHIKESEERFKRLFKGSPNYALAWQKKNGDFILVDYNHNMDKITKGHIVKRLGTTATQLYLKEQNTPILIEYLKKCFEEKSNFTKELNMDINFLGNMRDLNINYTYVPPNLVLINVEDITERKVAELQLTESEKRFRKLFKGTPNFTIAWQKTENDYIIIDYNDAADEATNGRMIERIGQTASQLYLKNMYRPDLIENLNECFEKRINISKEVTTFVEVAGQERDLIVRYTYVPPNLVLSNIEDITSRKRAQQQINEIKEKFRLLFENALDAIFWVNAETGLFINCNKSAEKLLERPKEDIIGKYVMIIYPPEYRKLYEKIFKKFVETGEYFNEETVVFTRSEKIIPVQLTASKTKIGNEEIIQAIFHDITDRKKAEKTIANLAKFPSENPNPTIRVTMKEIKYINQAGINLFNVEKGGKLPDEFDKYIQTALTKNINMSLDFQLKEKIYSFDLTPIQDQGYVNIYGRDITERKKAEQQLKESALLFQDLYEEAPNAYFSISPNESIIRCNRAAEKLLGYTREEMLGMKVFKLYENSKYGIEKAKKIFQRFIEGQQIQDEELQMKNKDGEIVWVSLSVKPIFDNEGKVLESRSMILNITQRKKIEIALRQSEEKYREAFDRANFYKDLFAHDINNIMQVINSSAELISYYLDETEKSKNIEMIGKMIKKQIARAKKLVQNVNILSQLEESEQPIKSTEINNLLENSIYFMRNSYPERKINLQIQNLDKRVFVQANELLQEVFENILTNAVKYNDKNIVDLEINILKDIKEGKNFIKIEFIDNSIGIEDQRKKIIFEKGHRNFRGAKGMGLGLSLVKKIINSYGGKVWIEDRISGDYKQGSKFVLIIPQAIL